MARIVRYWTLSHFAPIHHLVLETVPFCTHSPFGVGNCPILHPDAIWYWKLSHFAPRCHLVLETVPFCTHSPFGVGNCPILHPDASWYWKLSHFAPRCHLVLETVPFCTQMPFGVGNGPILHPFYLPLIIYVDLKPGSPTFIDIFHHYTESSIYNRKIP